VKKYLIVFVSVFVGLVVFMPKQELIFTGLNTLTPQKIEVGIEDNTDMWIYEDLKGLDVLYDKIKVAKIEDVKVFPFILYNRVSATSVTPADSFSSMFDVKAYKVVVSYVVFSPKKLSIDADTSIGKITGEYDLETSKIKIYLKPSADFKNFKQRGYFKKQKDGYVYESIIR